MKRLVSKLDYEIQRVGKYNINYAIEFWNLIKGKNFILQEFRQVPCILQDRRHLVIRLP